MRMGVSGDKGHSHGVRGYDLYETPPVAVEALLKAETLPWYVWEPACGFGAIARVLRAHGHEVWASDLIDYSTPDQDATGWDFLKQKTMPAGTGAILTNPPYRQAGKFVAQALTLASPLVIMLARLAFYESVGRHAIFADPRCARIHVFENRLPMMHRHGWNGPKSTSGVAFAWFVWDVAHRGGTIIDRIRWEPSP